MPAAIEKLAPFNAKDKTWRAIIETPKGSHNKYKFDEETGLFKLGGVLPEGMSFPYDFGFLPKTKAPDGDPIDVLLLMDSPAFCGCLVPTRLIGVIQANQTSKEGKTTRNDRIVAVPVDCRTYRDLKSLKDLNEHRLHEIVEFFVSYNRVRGREFDVLDIGSPEAAAKLAKEAMKPGRGKRKGK
jgi:inorganic pyrophosphatase